MPEDDRVWPPQPTAPTPVAKPAPQHRLMLCLGGSLLAGLAAFGYWIVWPENLVSVLWLASVAWLVRDLIRSLRTRAWESIILGVCGLGVCFCNIPVHYSGPVHIILGK